MKDTYRFRERYIKYNRKIFIFSIGIMIFILISGIYTIYTQYNVTVKKTGESLLALQRLLVEYTERTNKNISVVLADVSTKILAADPKNEMDFQNIVKEKSFFEKLNISTSSLKYISILDDKGNTLISTEKDHSISELNKQFFANLINGKNKYDMISPAIKNRSNGHRNFIFFKTIENPAGVFLGVVAASFDVDNLRSFYAKIAAPSWEIGLWKQDGHLLIRYPPLEKGYQLTKGAHGFNALKPGDAKLSSRKSLDGQWKLYSMVVMEEFSLVMIVARSWDDILSDWWPLAVAISISMTIIFTTIIVLLVLLNRQFAAYEAAAKAEEAQNQAERQLVRAQKMEAVGQLTAGIVHDLNNLLATIIGNLELLQLHVMEQSQNLKWVQNALTTAERGVVLIQQLLAFSRRQPIDRRPVCLRLLMDGIIPILQTLLGTRINLHIIIKPSLPLILTDPTQLEQAIVNLSINARDAVGDSGDVRLTAEWESGTDFVVISISDNGTGMTPDVLQNALEPFFTTKTDGKGTGLGLSQVERFITMSGGRMEIVSTVAVGTTVHLYLPIAVEKHNHDHSGR